MNYKLYELYTLCQKTAALGFKQRLKALAENLLGIEYGPWQNGSDLESLDDFKYDLKVLDCVTYAEVVLALMQTNPHQEYALFCVDFETNLRNIHYAQGIPNFLHRNHFFCIDWIANNKLIVADITREVFPSTKTAEAEIDRKSWFTQHAINAGRKTLPQHIIESLPSQTSIVPYVSTEELLQDYSNFVRCMPEYSLICIVRPNWDMRARIGTNLNISHLGLALKMPDNDDIEFFHATTTLKRVVQQSLREYMTQQLASPTIRGINIQALR